MNKIKLIFATAALCGGLTATTAASAMPIAPVPADSAANVEQVRWVCNPYGRCWWQPNYYGAYAYYPRHHHRHHHYRHHHYYY
jgi:hypothetical protein